MNTKQMQLNAIDELRRALRNRDTKDGDTFISDADTVGSRVVSNPPTRVVLKSRRN